MLFNIVMNFFNFILHLLKKWKKMFYRLQGEPVNLREQQDAVEFFYGSFWEFGWRIKSAWMSSTNGSNSRWISDQKNCQECPHRFSKEEPFSALTETIYCSLFYLFMAPYQAHVEIQSNRWILWHKLSHNHTQIVLIELLIQQVIY